MAKETVVLIVEDAANREKLTFSSWEEARNHIRMVILGQIVEELAELVLQDDPAQWKDEIWELRDIAKSINYPRIKDDLVWALEQWTDYTDKAPHYTTIEIL